jgi:hypothetical protein
MNLHQSFEIKPIQSWVVSVSSFKKIEHPRVGDYFLSLIILLVTPNRSIAACVKV